MLLPKGRSALEVFRPLAPKIELVIVLPPLQLKRLLFFLPENHKLCDFNMISVRVMCSGCIMISYSGYTGLTLQGLSPLNSVIIHFFPIQKRVTC